MVLKGEILVDVSKIKVGDVIANYPAMCKVLGEEPRKGKPQKRHIEGWKRFFKFEKDGHKYIILEIYETPEIKIDGRAFGNNSTYNSHTTILLLDYIYRSESIKQDEDKYVIEILTKTIINKVGLCNTNYDNEKFIKNLVSRETITQEDRALFYSRVGAKLHEVVKSTITNLVSTKRLDSVKQIHKITDNGELRTATDDEEKNIEEAISFVLSEMEIFNIGEVFVKYKQKEFYKKMNDELQNRYGWDGVFKTNKITLNDDIEEGSQRNILTQEEREHHLSIVNERIHAFIDNQAKEKFEYYLSHQNEDPDIIRGYYKLPSDYIEKQKLLSRALIKI